MAKNAIDVAILFCPEELKGKWQLFEFLLIKTVQNHKEFQKTPIENNSVAFKLINQADVMKGLLGDLSAASTKNMSAKLYAALSKGNDEAAGDKLVQTALMKHLQQQFERLKPFTAANKWYHRKIKPSGGFITSPCVFSKFRPVLEFMVTKANDAFLLQTFVKINGYTQPLESFTRHQFLLESNNEYFLLSLKDHQTLNWLQTIDDTNLRHNSASFATNILSKLETDYFVNRNNLFAVKEIVAEPTNRLLVSELNNAFLMLTPQWIYDGFLVENPWKPTYTTTLEGEEIAVVRNQQKEVEFVTLLQALHPNFANQKNGYFYLSFAEAQKKQWFLKTYHALLDQAIEVTGMDMLSHFRYSIHRITSSGKVITEANGKILLELKIAFGNEQLKLSELQRMLLSGQKAVLLKDGSLGILHEQWMQQYAAIIKHGKIVNNTVEVNRGMAISEQTKSANVFTNVLKTQWWTKWRQWQNESTAVYPVPATIKATLRAYQQKGFDWLALLAEAGAGGCLADDMGLGKTLQTICFMAHHLQLNPGSTNIIICPSSLIYNWERELEKFAPDIKTLVYYGPTRNLQSIVSNHAQIIITSYGTIRSDAALLTDKYFGVVVVDESHNIKNPAALITNAVTAKWANAYCTKRHTCHKNTFDLYAQLNFALPGMFGSREFFKREYADDIDRHHDEEKMAALQRLTAPFVLRRTKEQVATDLPQKTETILWCSMKNEQQALYDNVKDQIRGNLFVGIQNNGLNKSKFAVLQGLMKLKQICNSPLLLPIHEQEDCKQSIKTDVLFSELNQILKNHKALVFSQFSSMLNLVATECNRQGLQYYHFDGSTPAAKRAEMIEAFQHEDNETNLFLISLKAGNAGITLTAADYVFLFDPVVEYCS